MRRKRRKQHRDTIMADLPSWFKSIFQIGKLPIKNLVVRSSLYFETLRPTKMLTVWTAAAVIINILIVLQLSTPFEIKFISFQINASSVSFFRWSSSRFRGDDVSRSRRWSPAAADVNNEANGKPETGASFKKR